MWGVSKIYSVVAEREAVAKLQKNGGKLGFASVFLECFWSAEKILPYIPLLESLICEKGMLGAKEKAEHLSAFCLYE